MSWIGLYKLAVTVFEITQKPFYITSSNSRFSDNPISKYLIFKIVSCMQWLFWVIYQNYRNLGLAFGIIFSYKYFWFNTQLIINWQSFNVISFLSKHIKQNVLLRSYLGNSWGQKTLRFIFNHHLKQWSTVKKGRRMYKHFEYFENEKILSDTIKSIGTIIWCSEEQSTQALISIKISSSGLF